ncbi:hypothetical protein F2P81_008943 [Scophthalmus maximus]|uniref:Uncharacterized protein n=1 Tax=Scophthalmus maximus TaxID=52904 RepID=A0A6A4T0B9_SCOMX|nr:hypothetical protein F2P81_008943 [Scophthalmus maximus]
METMEMPSKQSAVIWQTGRLLLASVSGTYCTKLLCQLCGGGGEHCATINTTQRRQGRNTVNTERNKPATAPRGTADDENTMRVGKELVVLIQSYANGIRLQSGRPFTFKPKQKIISRTPSSLDQPLLYQSSILSPLRRFYCRKSEARRVLLMGFP